MKISRWSLLIFGVLFIGLLFRVHQNSFGEVDVHGTTSNENSISLSSNQIEKLPNIVGGSLSPFDRLDCSDASGVRLITTACNPEEAVTSKIDGPLQSVVVKQAVEEVQHGRFEAIMEINAIYDDCLRRLLNPGSVVFPVVNCDMNEMDIARSSLDRFLAQAAKSGNSEAVDAYARFLWDEYNRTTKLLAELQKPIGMQVQGLNQQFAMSAMWEHQKAAKASILGYLSALSVRSITTQAMTDLLDDKN